MKNGITIKQTSENSFYIEFNGYTIYVDDSLPTEFIVDVWREETPNKEIILTKTENNEQLK